MIFKLYVDVENIEAESNDSLISINSINIVDNIIEIEISRPDEEIAYFGAEY